MSSQDVAAILPSSKRNVTEQTIEQKQRMWGFIFLSPWIAGFLIFSLIPMLASFIYSFTDFQIGKEIHWIGLANWQKMFADPVTINSLGVTLRFGLIMLPINLIVPMGIAAMMTSKLVAGKPILRVLFYMPYVVPTISAVFVWTQFLHGQSGWLNRFLNSIGVVNAPNWVYDEHTVYIAMVMMGLWGLGNAMLTMMIAMQNIPTELYEAAKVDGAKPYDLFRHITLPLFSPMIFYNLILSVIALMQYFVVPYVLNMLNVPRAAVNFINLHLYRTAFQFQDMGYAATLAWFMFFIALILTVILFSTSRNWVYYGTEEEQK